MAVTRTGRGPGAGDNHEHYVYRILSALIREPERIVVTGSGLTLTAGKLAQSVCSVASLLRSNGITQGTTVAILTKANHPHMLTIRYAAHLVGATTAYIRSSNARSDEWMLPARDQVRMLTEVDAALLVTDTASLARGRELCLDLPCDVVAAELSAVTASESAVELGNAIHSLPKASYDPHSRLIVVYTSGSTGRPKGVCHSFSAWNNMVAGFEAVVRGASPPRFLAVTPIGQTVGVMLDGTLAAGGSLVLHEHFIVDEVLRAIADLSITDCYLAVPHIYALTDDPRIADLDLSRLRNVIYSGSPAAPHRIAQSARVFGRPLLQSYGSTEAGPISYLGSWEHRQADRLPTVGRPYPGVRVRVCQPGRTRELSPGHTGEIWIKSGNIMSEYLSDPELTAEVLRDGWLRTGDLGFLDDSGYLTLEGRIGHAIKNNGLKVYPDTIERTLMAHPDVSGAAVIGIRNRRDYEEAYAAVALRPNASVTLSKLREHLGDRLPADQVPAIIAQWAAIPIDDSGETDKRRLWAIVEAGDGARYGLLAEE